ncbi:MAG: ribosome recycling factor [bacterium]|nr:ribosome recycling factor [bacterium]
MPVDLNDIPSRMDKVLEIVSGEISSIRTGRASSALVENINCNVYGGTQRLKVVELGTIATPDPGTIIITPWDPSILGEIRNSIQAVNAGLTPIVDNQFIRIFVPSLSAERRQEYVKLLHKHLENGKVMIRQIRHDKMSDIKRSAEAKEMSEDDRFRMEEELQKLTDKYVEKIDEMGKKKEEELLAI